MTVSTRVGVAPCGRFQYLQESDRTFAELRAADLPPSGTDFVIEARYDENDRQLLYAGTDDQNYGAVLRPLPMPVSAPAHSGSRNIRSALTRHAVATTSRCFGNNPACAANLRRHQVNCLAHDSTPRSFIPKKNQ